MRGSGAAQRREEPPPDRAVLEAGLRRAVDGLDAVLGSMRRRNRAAAGIIGRLEQVSAACGDPHLADLAGRLAVQQRLLIVETISAAAHCAEAREAAERDAEAACLSAVEREACIAEGRRREAEEQAGQSRAPRARHARGRHLKLAGGAAVKAGIIATAASVAAGTVIAGHDSASVHRYVTSSPAAVRMHLGRPDTATRIPQPRSSPSPRPSVAAAGATPAPPAPPPSSASPSPPRVPSPPAPVAAPAVPALDVPGLLDLGAVTTGPLTLTALGQSVTWTATATDGIRLSSYAGDAVQGEPVTLEVTDPTGAGGWVYVSFGGTTVPVEVRSLLGVPAGL